MHNNYQFKLPTDSIVFLTPTKDGILFSQKAKNPSASITKNRAWTTLNAIKLGMKEGSHFMPEKAFGAEKISDVARAIYARYETRYNKSFWNSIIDTITSCFKIKSDLDKMQDLLNEILNHSKVKINQIKPVLDGREEGCGQLSESEDSQEFDFSNEEASEEISDQETISENFSEIDFEENIPLVFEKSDEHLLTFLSERVFIVQPHTLNISTLRLLEGLTDFQIQSLVELNKKVHICESMLETLLIVAELNECTPKFKRAGGALINAFFQAEPDAFLWAEFQRSYPLLSVPITCLKTMRFLNLISQQTISDAEVEQAVAEVRSSFQPIEQFMQHPAFESYSHNMFPCYTRNILSYIVNKSEGSKVAQLQLKLFIKAITLADHEDDKYRHSLDLIDAAQYLDRDPITEGCNHLPITLNFKLTPIILKTLIAEYAINQSYWDYSLLHRIESIDHVLVFIEAVLELPEYQQDILFSNEPYVFHKRGFRKSF